MYLAMLSVTGKGVSIEAEERIMELQEKLQAMEKINIQLKDRVRFYIASCYVAHSSPWYFVIAFTTVIDDGGGLSVCMFV